MISYKYLHKLVLACTIGNSWLFILCQFWFLIKESDGRSLWSLIRSNVSFPRMIVNRATLATIFLLGYSIAEPGTSDSSISMQAEATVEIQYDGEVGSGIILMTSCPAACTVSDASSLSAMISCSDSTADSASTALIASSPSTTVIWTSSTSSTSFNTPPIFGTSRTQMVNVSSTAKYLFPTATGSSQMITATNTQSSSESSTPDPHASLVAGLGIRPDGAWSHVFFWAAVTEILLELL